MKNPRTYVGVSLDRTSPPSAFQHLGGSALVPLVSVMGGQPVLKGGKKGGDGEEEADALTKALTYLKFTDEEVARITELVAAVASLATVVGWVGTAILTIKAVLSFLGVFGKEEDPQFNLMKAIGDKVQRIYGYLDHTNRRDQYLKAVQWRTQISEIRNGLSNLALSRSQSNLDALVANTKFLRGAIEEMLAPVNGEIPFMRSTYGYQETYPPTHWIAATLPFYMLRSDGAPIDYRDANKELGTMIWDPGYYIDVLFEAIGVRIAALAALEPAFRSTGYDRESLREMYAGIVGFIDRWNRSFFLTRIAGPIDPAVDPFSGGHRIAINPYEAWSSPESMSIPLGVVDPVSGMFVLEPKYSDGFALRRYSYIWSNGGETAYFVVDNYDAAVAKATKLQEAMRQEIRTRCGINRLYTLMHAVWSLIVGPIQSEFVDLTDATFASGALTQQALPEHLSLGIIGDFASKPGKKYMAHRYFQDVVKKFRIPMARRTDLSQIQLGYKLVVSVGGADGTAAIVLCEYSAPNAPRQDLPLFPTGTRSETLLAPSAVVYDVVQSSVFSIDDEDIFEKTGSVPGGKWRPYSVPSPGKQRLYLEPRPGSVRLQIDVTFEFNVQNPDHPFIGYADVEIASLDATAHPYGFIATVQVFETVVAAVDNGSRDVVQSQPADSMTLHFPSSFLVVEKDYFADRDEGYAAMDRILGSINERYVRAKAALGPIAPIERVSRQALVEQTLAEIADATVRERPEQMRVVLNRLQPRAPLAQVRN
jgi:hypothetical protein